MILTKALKSHFYVIVALVSILGSVIAAPYISNLASVTSLNSTALIPAASAVSLPYALDHAVDLHVTIKEKVGNLIRLDEWNNDADRNCEMSCTYVRFQPSSTGQAGLAYVTDSTVDLSGAKRVHFFFMGEKGGETVRVLIAGKNPPADQKPDSPFKEKFGKSSGLITLPNDWKRYEVSLNGTDLKGITAPFAIQLLKGKTSGPQGVNFKFIVFENQAADPRFALAAKTTTTNPTAPTNSKMVKSDNSPPIASNVSATTDQDKPVSISLKATDPDKGDTLTFSTSKTANGGQISNFDSKAGTLTYTPPKGFSGQDAFNFKAADSHGAASNTATVTISINKTNKPPIANAGSDATVNEGTRGYSLNGTGSTDSDGEITKYIWTQTAGPTVTLDTTSYPGYAIFDVPFVTGSTTKLTFKLVVEDNDGARSQPDSVVISIKDLGPNPQTKP
jgi:hypothetical protein